MRKFENFNINEDLANDFREIFDARLKQPELVMPKGSFKSTQPDIKLDVYEWKEHIRKELKKFA